MRYEVASRISHFEIARSFLDQARLPIFQRFICTATYFLSRVSLLRRHEKILKLAKGFRGRNKNCFRIAKGKVDKALQYAYRCEDSGLLHCFFYLFMQLTWNLCECAQYCNSHPTRVFARVCSS